MVSRLLFILALLHAKTDAVLEIARPRQPQPKAIRIAPPDRPTTDSRGGAVAAWHAERKNALTRKLGTESLVRAWRWLCGVGPRENASSAAETSMRST